MESSEVVREKEHPLRKRWIIAVTLVILTILGLLYGLSQEVYPFYTRYFNRYTRGRFDSSSNCMGSSHTESAYWVYSRNMFSCIWYTAKGL